MSRPCHFSSRAREAPRWLGSGHGDGLLTQNAVAPAPLSRRLGTLSTQALIDGLWVMGWPTSFIEGARGLEKGQKCCGRAVTLRFVPQRPDIAADKPAGESSPEYEAFEKCGPKVRRRASPPGGDAGGGIHLNLAHACALTCGALACGMVRHAPACATSPPQCASAASPASTGNGS